MRGLPTEEAEAAAGAVTAETATDCHKDGLRQRPRLGARSKTRRDETRRDQKLMAELRAKGHAHSSRGFVSLITPEPRSLLLPCSILGRGVAKDAYDVFSQNPSRCTRLAPLNPLICSLGISKKQDGRLPPNREIDVAVEFGGAGRSPRSLPERSNRLRAVCSAALQRGPRVFRL
jgi:hypothetical protein